MGKLKGALALEESKKGLSCESIILVVEGARTLVVLQSLSCFSEKLVSGGAARGLMCGISCVTTCRPGLSSRRLILTDLGLNPGAWQPSD